MTDTIANAEAGTNPIRRRPPVKPPPRAVKAWNLLNEKGVVHSTCGIDRRAFEHLQRHELAVVTIIGRQEWVAELDPRLRVPLSMAIPAPVPPVPPSADDLALLPLRIREPAHLAAARIHRKQCYDYTEVVEAGEVVGWVYGIYDREFGWVTADAQTEQPRYSSREDAAGPLRVARRAELAATAHARQAAAAVHPTPHVFRPIPAEDDQRVLGWTFRPGVGHIWNRHAWVTADGTVGRRTYKYGTEAAHALRQHLAGPEDLWQSEAARERVRRVHRRSFNFTAVNREGPQRPFLGWVFYVAPRPNDFAYGTHVYGWVTQAGQVGGELATTRDEAMGALAADWVLDQPHVAPRPVP
ncbi:hypothetical protein [Streptomyces hesseae]|uniref:Uncharacterized protein n=1 Tax=Streptomyces hesseae TaxID=3075519 RepID=A0ABU2SXR2_9ACTN|nr:hypothetical protein [Streptomyces sp. DSM 40473]MDT0453789.1 hypothetical protein [Streptomyces sp. DSM 40473]